MLDLAEYAEAIALIKSFLKDQGPADPGEQGAVVEKLLVSLDEQVRSIADPTKLIIPGTETENIKGHS